MYSFAVINAFTALLEGDLTGLISLPHSTYCRLDRSSDLWAGQARDSWIEQE